MLSLGVAGGTPLRRVLAIGAHSDDLEIGCGGTILALTRANPGLAVDWVVLAASGDRAGEARRSAEVFLSGAAASSVEVLGFRDGYLPHTAAEVKDAFEELKERVQPDLVLTHTRDDLHQDHRLVCELTWNTFRDHMVLEYEIPKWDGDIGQAERLRPPRGVRGAGEARPARRALRHPARQGLVRRRGVPRSDENAGHGVQGSERLRRGVCRPQADPRTGDGGRVVKVLVTGSAGYVGSVICPIFEHHGHDVVGLDTGYYDGCDFGDYAGERTRLAHGRA